MAARITDEIGALTWVTCPQRVTTMNPADLTIAGWSGGMLVQFQIHGGRLGGWSQRSCSHPAATDALAAGVASPAGGGSRLGGMEDDGPLLSIGELARRAGLPVRTIRFWSDAGVLPPAAWTGGGRRLYDAAGVARLELVVTLRELGLRRR